MAAPPAAAGQVEGVEEDPHQAPQPAATGIPDGKAYEWANSRLGYWRIARSWVLTRSLTNAYWREQGLQGFTDPYRRFRDATRTAGCGPARPVVWEGRGISPAPTRLAVGPTKKPAGAGSGEKLRRAMCLVRGEI